MKLSSKIISALLMIVVLSGICVVAPVSVMAEGVTTLSIEDTTVKSVEQVEFKVVLKNAEGVCGGNFTLEYDADMLDFETYEYGDLINKHTKNCNPDYKSAGNLVRFTFSGAEKLDADGTLITFTFNVKSEGEAGLEFTQYKMYSENGMSLSTTAVGSVVKIKFSDADVKDETIKDEVGKNEIIKDGVCLKVEGKDAEAGEFVRISVVISNASSVYGGNFTLEYDSLKLQAESFEYCDILSGYTKNCNLDYKSEGNLIRLTFNGTDALVNGTLVTLTFYVKAEGEAPIKFTEYKMYNESGVSLTADAVDAVVKIGDFNDATKDKSTMDEATKDEATEDEIYLTVESKDAAVGELIRISVVLSNAASVYGGNFTLEYDSLKLQAESFEFGDALSSYTKNCNLDYRSEGNIIRFTFSGAEALGTEADLITFTFSVKSEGKAGLKFTEYRMYDENGAALTASADEGVVDITINNEPQVVGLLGDADENGIVNIKDATAIQKSLANMRTLTEVGIMLADADGNGNLNIKDATAIQKFLASIDTGIVFGEVVL